MAGGRHARLPRALARGQPSLPRQVRLLDSERQDGGPRGGVPEGPEERQASGRVRAADVWLAARWQGQYR
eukprot:2236827-Pyramimonas_sp.AAC.1